MRPYATVGDINTVTVGHPWLWFQKLEACATLIVDISERERLPAVHKQLKKLCLNDHLKNISRCI